MSVMTLKPVPGHYVPAVESKEHQAWRSMIQRCLQESNPSFHNYGGRGIKVCDRWLDGFVNFLEDMGEAKSGLSIDRIDNDGDYEPSNCRWATKKEQARNRRTNRVVVFEGRPMALIEAAELSGLSHPLLLYRIKAGWSDDRLFSVAATQKRTITRGNKYEVNGQMMSVQEIAKLSGVSAATIVKRVAAGVVGKDLTAPSARPYRFRPT